jgi:pimeloyl-ACP methyl ester carboxylesterase
LVPSRFAIVNGLRLHYRESGPANGTPVVVLHGIMGHAREWDHLVGALAVRFRVIALDARGHGQSDWATDYSPESLAHDLVGLVRHLQLRRVRLVGHSMGGITALLCAAEQPDLVDRLVLIDIGPDSLTSEHAAGDILHMLGAFTDARYGTPDEAVDEWLAGNPLASPAAVRHYVEHNLQRGPDGLYAWRFDARRLGSFVRDAQAEWRLWKAVDLVRAPTLLIRGARSDVLSAATAEEMIRCLTHGSLCEIPDAGHDIGVEQPEAAAAAVRSFLET